MLNTKEPIINISPVRIKICKQFVSVEHKILVNLIITLYNNSWLFCIQGKLKMKNTEEHYLRISDMIRLICVLCLVRTPRGDWTKLFQFFYSLPRSYPQYVVERDRDTREDEEWEKWNIGDRSKSGGDI